MSRFIHPPTAARQAEYKAKRAAKASQADPANMKLARRAAKRAFKAAEAQRRAYAYRKQQKAVAEPDGASTASRCYSKASKPSKRRAAQAVCDNKWRKAWLVNHVQLMERLDELDKCVKQLAADLGVPVVAYVAGVAASVAGGVAGVAAESVGQ